MDIETTLVKIKLEDSEWTDISQVFDYKRITVKNLGGSPISLLMIDSEAVIPDIDEYIEEEKIDPVEIGGVTYEVSCKDGETILAKALTGSGELSVRLFGTVDPSEDLPTIANHFNEITSGLNKELSEHKLDKANPHEVTKEQVGLGNVPNQVVDDLLDKDEEDTGLSTIGAVRDVYELLQGHCCDDANPHKVTKDQVGLSLVENFGIASEQDAKDETCVNKYMTPASTATAIWQHAELAYSTQPEQVTAGQVFKRPEDWLYDEMSPISNLVEILDNLKVKVNTGLQVSFAYEGRSILSNVLENELEFTFPPDASIGIHYLYVDLDENKNIVKVGSTLNEPYEDYFRRPLNGDFFNIARCIMYDSELNPLRRVYISKIYIDNVNTSEDLDNTINERKIVNIVNVPVGNSTILPIILDKEINLGDKVILDNPYIAPTEMYAQVKYKDKWGETGWNDQMGVLAYPNPDSKNTSIIVQFGLMGYIASSTASGNALGVEESVIKSDGLKFNVVVTRRYR